MNRGLLKIWGWWVRFKELFDFRSRVRLKREIRDQRLAVAEQHQTNIDLWKQLNEEKLESARLRARIYDMENPT